MFAPHLAQIQTSFLGILLNINSTDNFKMRDFVLHFFVVCRFARGTVYSSGEWEHDSADLPGWQ